MNTRTAARSIAKVLSLLLVVPMLAIPASAMAQTGEPSGTTPRFIPEKPERTEVPEGYSRSEAHLKFREGTEVRLRDGRFASLGNDDLSGLQEVLDTYPELVPSRLFSARSEEELAGEKIRLERLSGRRQADKNLYFSLFFPETMADDVEAALDAFNALGIVEIAYPVPLPAPDPTMHTPDFRPQQGYREAAPGGIHADAANTVPGGRGENVQIIDVERFFVQTHEDLPAVTVYPNGDPSGDTQPFDHGTAVLAEMFGVDNGFGVLGIADQAAAGFVPRAGGNANAIDVATASSSAGDVILLEFQLAGANGGCTAMSQVGCVAAEFVQANYDAIVAATSAGIVVVEAAGNGSQDLDQPEYDDAFRDRPDSGAIMVGAGDGCPDPYPERGRLGFSTFGARVDLQGWGNCVTTAGYGGLQGSSESDDSYVASFSGTSSASPIVAAAAGVVSSVAIEQGDANGLSSTEARSLLVATGTPQDTSVASLTGNIGPLPNLATALGLTADVEVTKSSDPEPTVAGEDVTWTVTVTNLGPEVATDVEVFDDIPAGVTVTALPATCTEDGAGDVSCDLGTMAATESIDLELTADIDHDLVFNAGSPVVLTNSASSTSTLADPNHSNNTAAVDSNVFAVADLALVSVEVLDAPTEAVIGQDHQVTVRSDAGNLGPSWPMNAELATTATPSAGANVAPGGIVTDVPALQPDTPVQVDQDFTITCEEPGSQQVDFDVALSPANAEDADPNLTNNLGGVSVTLECIVPVVINIRPGNVHNHIPHGSNGVVSVAALTTAAGEYGLPVAFDATLIDAATVRFGEPGFVLSGGGATIHGNEQIKDAHELNDKSKDGDDDMVMRFRVSEAGLDETDTEACVRGTYVDGGSSFTFVGCDFIQPIP